MISTRFQDTGETQHMQERNIDMIAKAAKILSAEGTEHALAVVSHAVLTDTH